VHTPPAAIEIDGSAGRLRFIAGSLPFAAPAGGTARSREIYLADVAVQVERIGSGQIVFQGVTDLAGEVDLPKLETGNYRVLCATEPGATLAVCRNNLTIGASATATPVLPEPPPARNLRLYGHIGVADGSACGTQNKYFNLQSAATVQLMQAGTPIGAATRVNRFGDYAIDAAVVANAALQLQVRCDGLVESVDIPADPAGYVSTRPIERSHLVANHRPTITKMVANGPEGNVRGQMIVPESGSASERLLGADRFLSYKGLDTRLSACKYYRALGAVADCDAQGNMIEPITLDDWKRRNKFAPYLQGNTEVAANYINKMDLNLVRRMTATRNGPEDIAFVVCNHPGPEGSSQTEVNQVMSDALDDELRQVACVAMEWSVTPGVNNNRPFTKFYTFGPDGGLLASINLDGRGEKYLPGACVACHGGAKYNGRFPEAGNPSPYLGASFLPFDTGNYFFSTRPSLTEAAQTHSIRELNLLVRETEGPAADTSITRLIDQWYAGGASVLNKEYVPTNWANAEATRPGTAKFYQQVIGSACRTCHVSLGSTFDWDTTVLDQARAKDHVCGGSSRLVVNASMPNALISRDRVMERVQRDPQLVEMMNHYLGCSEPAPDPIYPR
jgi:hypothetical protein